MRKQIFIPLSDEMLFDHPEQITGPVVPYCHLADWRVLGIGESSADNDAQTRAGPPPQSANPIVTSAAKEP